MRVHATLQLLLRPRFIFFLSGAPSHAGRQDEELEYLRNMLEKQKAERERAIDKGLLERELEAAKKQAGAVRSTVEVTARDVGSDQHIVVPSQPQLPPPPSS